MRSSASVVHPLHRYLTDKLLLDQLRVGLRENALVVLPTDTVYGIGSSPFHAEAVDLLLRAKGRGITMPPPVLVSSWAMALEEGIVDFSSSSLPCVAAKKIADSAAAWTDAYWPGALTLILPAGPKISWNLDEVKGTVALRVPGHQHTIDLLSLTGPLAVTSANLTGEPPALTVEQAREYFGDDVRFYCDGGPAMIGQASTIINCCVPTPKIIRSGAVPFSALNAIAELVDDEDRGGSLAV